jgi:hypothetical protein
VITLKKNAYLFAALLSSMMFSGKVMADSKVLGSPESGRLSLFGAGSGIGVFGGDAMLPVFGNNQQFAYADFMGDYGTNDTYLISPGGGYRGIVNNQILGVYCFGDYQRTDLGQDFWVVNPGIEWISPHWDWHLNVYIPPEDSKQSGDTVFASTLGDDNAVSFENGTHNQYDELVAPFVVIGHGVDTEIGYSFSAKDNLRSRVYLGGYYYQPPSSANVENFTGVTAGFEQAITKNYSIALFNSYDQLNHYVAGVSLTVTFGGESNLFSNNVQDRMLDPVQRHVGIINTGAGTYDQESLEDQGYGLQYDNVYFLTPDGTGNGTYGNPAALTQSTLDTVNLESPNTARIYLQGGQNAIYNINENTTSGTTGLSVYNGQDFYGRTADYTAPADSNAQPLIQVDTANNYSGFFINDSANLFSDLTVSGEAATDGYDGFNVVGDSSLSLVNMTVENFNYAVVNMYARNSEQIINVTNSSLINNTDGIFSSNNNNGTININVMDSNLSNNLNNSISVRNNTFGGSTGTSVVSINNSVLDSNQNSGLFAQNAADGNLIVSIDNSDISGNVAAGVGISNDGGTGLGTATVNIQNSAINNNGVTTSDANLGINNTNGTTTVTATNSSFSGAGFTGIYVANSGSSSSSIVNMTLSNSTINNNVYYGIYGQANSGTSTTINYATSTLSGNNAETNQADGDNITWISD